MEFRKALKKHGSLATYQSITGLCFALPGLIGFLGLIAIPFAMTLYYSVTGGAGQFVFLDNYIDLFKSNSFRLALMNTLRFSLAGILILLVLSLLLSIMFYHQIKRHAAGIHILKSAIILPIVIPTASIILVVQILFERYGILNGLRTAMSLVPVRWFDEAPYCFWILIGLYLWKNCGYCLVILLGAYETIDPAIIEAANCDGANRMKQFFYITLPQIKTSLFFIVIIGLIGIFRIFRESYLLMGNYPHERVYMLQNFINNNMMNLNYQRMSSAAIVFLLIMSVLVVIFLHRNSKEDT